MSARLDERARADRVDILRDEAPAELPPPVTAHLPGGVWIADPAYSYLGFAVTHMCLTTFRGGFGEFEATLTVGDSGAAHLDGVARADSILVRDRGLAERLRARSFLDVATHPELRLKSTVAARGHLVEIDGALTIRGRTLAVVATGTVSEPRRDPRGELRLGLQLETVVDRRQFGLDWNVPLPGGGLLLGNEVELHADLQLVRSATSTPAHPSPTRPPDRQEPR